MTNQFADAFRATALGGGLQKHFLASPVPQAALQVHSLFFTVVQRIHFKQLCLRKDNSDGGGQLIMMSKKTRSGSSCAKQ